MTLDTASLVATLAMSLLNVFYVCKRADDAGINQRPYLRAIAYLVLATLDRSSPEFVNKVIKDALQHDDGTPWPEAIRTYALEPVLRQLLGEVTDVCTRDCARVLSGKTTLAASELDRFWDRLRLPPEGNRKQIVRKSGIIWSSSCTTGHAKSAFLSQMRWAAL
jgi:hypothetical protein